MNFREYLKEAMKAEHLAPLLTKYLEPFKTYKEFKDQLQMGIGQLSISEIVSEIDKHSEGRLDFNQIRKALGNYDYFPMIIDIKIPKMDDKNGMVDIKTLDFKDRPIVIGPDREIIDGRHRTLMAKKKGSKKIRAYVPDNIMWKIIKKEKIKK